MVTEDVFTRHVKPRQTSDLATESFHSHAAGSHCDLTSIFSECNTLDIIPSRDEEGGAMNVIQIQIYINTAPDVRRQTYSGQVWTYGNAIS